MKYFPAPRLCALTALIVLLLLTLGSKLAVPHRDYQSEEKEAQRNIVDFLAQQYFSVSTTDKMEEGKPWIVANSGACRMLVVKSPAMGWDRNLLRQYVTPGDHAFVVFEGRVYEEQPTWLTVFSSLRSRMERELGFGGREKPVFGIVAAASCNAEQLPWARLARMSP